MKRDISMVRIVLTAAVAATLGLGLTACGDDDKKASADCSKCPSGAQSECASSASECTSKGGSATDCQAGIDAFCALAAAFNGDGGLTPPPGDSGTTD